MTRAVPLLLALAAAILTVALVLRMAPLRTNMADFLPRGAGGEHRAAMRLLLGQLASGPASRTVLIGVEGAPPTRLARLSRRLAAALSASGRFSLVADGVGAMSDAEQQALFRYRYLLSPTVSAASFSEPALHRDLRNVLRGLLSSASPLVVRYGLADPTGAFPALLKHLAGHYRLRRVDGVWFAPHRDRALLIAESRGGALDEQGAAAMVALVRQRFATLDPRGARLLLAGPAVMGAAAAAVVRGDVERLSLVSTFAVLTILFWRFRSLAVVAIAVPVLLSIAVATLALMLTFGFVPGIAFGFGMTMLGVSVDYPVLLIGHRKQGEAAAGTLRRIGAALGLTVAAASLGLTGMVLSGFPWLTQLGLFALAGLLGAYAATRTLLPRLIVAADLAPVPVGDPARYLAAERWRRWRNVALLAPAAGAAFLLVQPPRWQRSLARLSPVPVAAKRTDASLRADLGAPDAGVLALVRGPSVETVLQREEALSPVLSRMVTRGIITGTDFAASILPSVATQRARAALLPGGPTLTARLARARKGLPYRPDAFAPFLADVAASRTLAPLTLPHLPGPVLRARLAPLLYQNDGGWNGPILFSGVTDAAALTAALVGHKGVVTLDVPSMLDTLARFYTRRAGALLGLGAAASFLLLALILRDGLRLMRVTGAIASALIVTLAILDAAGARLSLLHILSLQLVLGIGLDYALFFSRPRLDAEERIRTLRTLITCNGLTLAGFGTLALAETPLLREIGATTAIGALCAMVFSFLFAAPAPETVEETA